MSDLKKCPFCGGEAKVVTNANVGDMVHVWITCTKCGGASPMFSCQPHMLPRRMRLDDEILAPVVKSWNRRVE